MNRHNRLFEVRDAVPWGRGIIIPRSTVAASAFAHAGATSARVHSGATRTPFVLGSNSKLVFNDLDAVREAL